MRFGERVTAAAIEWAELGYVPDALLRRGMRHLCRQRLRSEVDCQVQLEQFMARARQAPVALVPETANQQHYEVPAEFFRWVLGPRRKYSCCYWDDQTSSLAAAEEAALRKTCEHAELEDGQRILELGCGWGSLTLWMAEQFPSCQITAVSNSHSQREFILDRARELGCNRRLQVVTADMNDFAAAGRFDRVVSVEMFEHMRNHAELLRRIAGWLEPTGQLLVHIFCHRQRVYEFQEQGPADWMTRHFFTGGMMPSHHLLANYDENMEILETWRWGGTHYCKTVEAWLKNMEEHQVEIMDVLRNAYPQEDAGRWYRRWRMFFMACSELFGYAHGNEWYVVHHRLQPVPVK